MSKRVAVIGGGLAGTEAAWQLARRGAEVDLFEMRPTIKTAAHKTSLFSELVCSNSFGSLSSVSASGLLKQELRKLGSLTLDIASECAVPAGSSLAVDRQKFSEKMTQVIMSEPLIKIKNEEIKEIPREGLVILATGPLTSESLSQSLIELLGEKSLYFYDAISPIVSKDSLDLNKMFFANRYDKGETADFLNLPLSKEQYEKFIFELLNGEVVLPHDFEEEKYFEGCMPIEALASRGEKTLAFGPMKPVGLIDPKSGQRPYAVIQLRAENRFQSAYNLVGFQTKLRYKEQERIFRSLPGLENAEFLRLGSMHRNTFINSPKHLLPTLQLKLSPSLFIAGQLTGTEGYLESSAGGLVAGINAWRILNGHSPHTFPQTTLLGSLLGAITDPSKKNFQPMNVNMGLLPPPSQKRIKEKKKKYEVMVQQAGQSLDQWLLQPAHSGLL